MSWYRDDPVILFRPYRKKDGKPYKDASELYMTPEGCEWIERIDDDDAESPQAGE